jgi:hypothetical protein
MKDSDFLRIQALFDSLKRQKQELLSIKESKNLRLLSLGCPNETILDIAAQSLWHRKLIKVAEECIKELEDLIKNELKQLK